MKIERIAGEKCDCEGAEQIEGNSIVDLPNPANVNTMPSLCPRPRLDGVPWVIDEESLLSGNVYSPLPGSNPFQISTKWGGCEMTTQDNFHFMDDELLIDKNCRVHTFKL